MQGFHTFGNKTLINVAFLSSRVPGTAFRKMLTLEKSSNYRKVDEMLSMQSSVDSDNHIYCAPSEIPS